MVEEIECLGEVGWYVRCCLRVCVYIGVCYEDLLRCIYFRISVFFSVIVKCYLIVFFEYRKERGGGNRDSERKRREREEERREGGKEKGRGRGEGKGRRKGERGKKER